MKTTAHILLAALTALALVACERDVTYEEMLEVAEDSQTVQQLWGEVFETVDEESKSGENADSLFKRGVQIYRSQLDTCALITLNTNGGVFPMTLRIDWGTGCTGVDSRLREGALDCEFTGLYSDPGTEVTITTDQYRVNGYGLEGTQTITNDGRNAANNLEFRVSVPDGIITTPAGEQLTWRSERVHEWTAGESTNFVTDGLAGVCDDDYLIRGYGEGESSEGTGYRIESTEDLEWQICCFRPTDGILDYSIEGTSVAQIDYSANSCTDPTANVTFDGRDYVIVVL